MPHVCFNTVGLQRWRLQDEGCEASYTLRGCTLTYESFITIRGLFTMRGEHNVALQQMAEIMSSETLRGAMMGYARLVVNLPTRDKGCRIEMFDAADQSVHRKVCPPNCPGRSRSLLISAAENERISRMASCRCVPSSSSCIKKFWCFLIKSSRAAKYATGFGRCSAESQSRFSKSIVKRKSSQGSPGHLYHD